MEHNALLGLAIGAVLIGLVPIVAYLFVDEDSWLNPYRSRAARWAVYLGGLIGLVAFAWLSRTT